MSHTDLRKEYKITMLHICGKAGMRLPEIMRLGINGFSVDSMVSIPDTMKEAAGKVCMMGNFNPNALLRDGTPQECYDAAMANLDVAGLNGGYVMMPGCDLAAKTPEDNLRALVRAAKDYAQKHA